MALQKLREFFKETNSNNFQSILNKRVVVVEKVHAPSFYLRRNRGKFEFYKGSNKEPLTIVDRTLMSLYESAIKHIEGISPQEIEKLPNDWKFGFEYLPETGVSNFKYTKLPTNNLILTHIQQITESGNVKKTIIDPNILNKWASTLEVDAMSVVFDGKLNFQQKKELTDLLETTNNEYSSQYGYGDSNKQSFTKKIYKIFNPNASNSLLNENLDVEIDGLILNFVDGKKIKSFKLEDFNRENVYESRESSHIYQITIADILEYFTKLDLSKIQLHEESANKRYIELISNIFNDYVDSNSKKYIGVNFESADFAELDSFKLNTSFIQNEKTIQYVSNPILEELFKITLGSFRKERTKASDILTEDMIKKLNEVVKKIEEKVFIENADENTIYDYKNFMLASRIKENSLNEALTINHKSQGKQPVNIFVGRFQPFTLGHAKVLQALHKENGFPVIVFLIKSKTIKKGDDFKRPYSEDLQIKMFKQVQKEYKFLEDIIVLNTAAIDKMFNALRPKYEPVLWGTGSDRMKSYGYQVNNDSYRQQLGVRDNFGLFEIPRTDDNISATKVRNAMLDDNEMEFKSMTPRSLHKMYNVLKGELEKSMNLVPESNGGLMTFEEFMKNI